jgi:hypothetical protein
MDLPPGATCLPMAHGSLLMFAGCMVQFIITGKSLPPTLGILVQHGSEALLQSLLHDGNSQHKAKRLVREAEQALETTKVAIDSLKLGQWTAQRYSYTFDSIRNAFIITAWNVIRILFTEQSPNFRTLVDLKRLKR